MESIRTTSIARISETETPEYPLFDLGDFCLLPEKPKHLWVWTDDRVSPVSEHQVTPSRRSHAATKSSVEESFRFERIYGPELDDAEFYEQAIKLKIDSSCQRNRNVSFLLHGKSANDRSILFGDQHSPGIAYSVLLDFLRRESPIHVRLSAMGLLRETLHDLHLGEACKSIASDPTTANISTVQDVYAILYTIEATQKKILPSSGMHIILTISVQHPNFKEQKITLVSFCTESSTSVPSPAKDDEVSVSAFTDISEEKRKSYSGNDEAIARKTMLALIKCFSMRKSSPSQMFHSRESKFTTLLRPNLVHDDFIVVCTIDPTVDKESINTLRFSSSLVPKLSKILVDASPGPCKTLFQDVEESVKKPKAFTQASTLTRSRTPPAIIDAPRVAETQHNYAEIHRHVTADLVGREILRGELVDQRIASGFDRMSRLNDEIALMNEKDSDLQQKIRYLQAKKNELTSQKAHWKEKLDCVQREIQQKKWELTEAKSLYETLRTLLGKSV